MEKALAHAFAAGVGAPPAGAGLLASVGVLFSCIECSRRFQCILLSGVLQSAPIHRAVDAPRASVLFVLFVTIKLRPAS